MDAIFHIYKQSNICFYKAGHGTKKLLCLHGYGETGKSFECIVPHLQNDYTIYAIDFPHHGQTNWQEGNLFEPDSFVQIIKALGLAETDKISILAYSMGGRMALHLMQMMPQQIEKVVLLAPDGMRMNFWYWLGTQTFVGNKIFYYTMQNPNWFRGLLKGLVAVKIVDSWIVRFVNQFLNDPMQRSKLYNIWTTMRQFRPQHSKVKTKMKTFQIPLRLLYGKFDKVIQTKYAEKFQSQIPQLCTLKVMDAGHQLLNADNAAAIALAVNTN
jgi:pimeloyl-ACP methyl ester carboxylesterase